MLLSGSGGQPSEARGRVQAGGRTASVGHAFCVLLAALALGGCSSQSWSSINPISWWHNLEGGAIAQQRPPPPGADQPPPNLASVPPKPEEPDPAALQNIADALVADRTNAQHMAEAAPLVDPSSPSAAPSLFSVGSVPPPGPPPPPSQAANSATLPAASAPPAPPPAAAQATPPAAAPAAPPAKAPVGEVKTAALPEPTPPPPPLSVGPELPPLPTAPPPPANVASPPPPPAVSAPASAAVPPAVPVPAHAAAPAVPPAPKPAASPATAHAVTTSAPPKSAPAKLASLTPIEEPTSSGNTVAVVFASGASEIPPSAAAPLRALAGRRGNGLIEVTGFGDAPDASPDAQAAALKLGLSRAQSIAAALVADGVPATAVQLDAQAIGRGGTARLVQ